MNCIQGCDDFKASMPVCIDARHNYCINFQQLLQTQRTCPGKQSVGNFGCSTTQQQQLAHLRSCIAQLHIILKENMARQPRPHSAGLIRAGKQQRTVRQVKYIQPIHDAPQVICQHCLAHCIERHACHIVGGHAVQQIQAIPPLRPQPAHGSALKQDAPSMHGCI